MTSTVTPVYGAQGEQVVLGRELGHGARADVFLLRNRPDLVAKRWRDELKPGEAAHLRALVAAHTPELEAVSTWPVNTLHDHRGRVLGLVRPYVNTGDFREVIHLYSPALRARAFTGTGWAFRVRVAAAVAQAFAALHGAGQVMGDVNPLHVLVSSQGRVRLVNVDAWQLTAGGEVYRTPTATALFLPPELQERELEGMTRTAQHDVFGLAVLVFLLVFDGRHPYAGVPAQGDVPVPARAIAEDAYAYARPPRPGVRPPPEGLPMTALPPALQGLFAAAFAPAHAERPTAAEWARELGILADTLVACERDDAHQHEIGAPCPWCELEAIREVSPFTSDRHGPEGSAQAAQVEALWQGVIHVPAPERLQPPAEPAALPELPLNLPTPPNAVAEAQVERALRWTLRILVLVLLFGATFAVQRSVVAGLVIPALLVLAFTVGRRVSVDWDAMIEGYQNWEGRLTERLLPARGKWQTYHTALAARRAEVDRELDDLRARQRALEERLTRENARAEYDRDFAALDAQRRALLQGEERQWTAVEALVLQRRERATLDFLKRQPIRAGILPYFTTRHELQLAGVGLRTAADVTAARVDDAPEGWRPALILWRQGLEDYLPVSVDLVSAEQVQAVRAEHRARWDEGFEEYRRAVNAFRAARWGAEQAAVQAELGDVAAQVAQHQRALKTLGGLARQG
ncbi:MULTISPECIES: hypothetical protein [Deinococcus]|uniref:Protein kinase domain-containing protein n=1 Tax=Deinococcus rufus TaxID=2136097 RepID=A0ABV7ZD02_9DEIO|nr:hypothetical protein [Deinococcus sp. AB2017081]WQE94943.1 hypothetical protein U2P90_16360 [Deinococcus sp. AB2017081]